MKTIYLVRHGEARDDVEGLYGGAADHEPTEKSLKDAEKFAKTFKDKGIQIVISSPYLRAKNPATIIAQKLGVPIDFENDLREMNRYGPLTGMNKDEARVKFPELVERIEKGEDIEGAEPERDFRERITGVMDKIWQRKENVILVLTHWGVIRMALGFKIGETKVSHYGWVKATKEAGGWKILEERDVTHP